MWISPVRSDARHLCCFYIVFALSIFLAPTIVFADANFDRQTQQIDEKITVFGKTLPYYATKQPRAYSYLDQPQLNLIAAPLTLSEYLNSLPSVYLQASQNFSQDERISIRGFGAQSSFGIRGIQILVDDVPHTLPDGQSQLDGLELQNLASIEVLRGPASALYGNSAGGVIKINTQVPDDDKLALKLTKGSFDTEQAYLYANKHYDTVNFGVSLSHTQKQGYRDHSEYEKSAINGHLDWQVLPQWLLRVNSQYIDSPIAEDAGGLTREQADSEPTAARDRNVSFQAGEEVKQQKHTLASRYQFDDSSQLNAQFYYFDKDFNNRLPFSAGGQVELARQFYGTNVQYATHNWLTHYQTQVLLGANLQYQDDKRRRYDNLDGGIRGDLALSQQELIDSSALYAQLSAQPSDKWLIDLGLRYEHNRVEVKDQYLVDGDQSGERNWDNSSANLGSSYQLTDDNLLYATISQSFQIPTTTELANPNKDDITANGGFGGGFNPDLDVETAINYEIGLRGELTAAHSYDLALFYIDISDAISPYFKDDSLDEITYYRNAGAAARQGIEVSSQHQFGSHFSWKNQYSYSDFSYDSYTTPQGDYSGKIQPGTPRHKGASQLLYQNDNDLSINLELLYVGDRYTNNSNTETADSYWLTNAGVSQVLDFEPLAMSLSLTVNNLFNQYYDDNIRINAFGGRYYEPGPERLFMFTLAATL
ncbi:TonB-dependent receptor [Shewanella sp. 1_MG-2023]|uniref:TonB-dependent receptor family protein n=1 Tax=unclassified Shewanella TaxID=196818 RepID=UPI0026E3F017|nr:MULTISPECIES: TonB-dependent receptor [unclassified Shewanella]MDO6611513.1 TonB-dependent receptor [Shewanella sp. 7_MG-2023]MDO6771368.1 TonB-dependent receptor [Shewanella sp. 2_MG-2023]MDO6793594.1 TonB-dependent receptor [Shewanella sp. 1_MG-2023]